MRVHEFLILDPITSSQTTQENKAAERNSLPRAFPPAGPGLTITKPGAYHDKGRAFMVTVPHREGAFRGGVNK